MRIGPPFSAYLVKRIPKVLEEQHLQPTIG